MQQDYNAIWITATKDPASGNVRWGIRSEPEYDPTSSMSSLADHFLIGSRLI